MIIFSLMLAATTPNPPKPLTEIQQRDIACVAVIALHARGQRNQWEGYDEIADLETNGKKWAGIAGERIMAETGQTQELIGFAIEEAAKVEQGRINVADEPRSVIYERIHDCLPIMEAELAQDAAANKPLPKPQ